MGGGCYGTITLLKGEENMNEKELLERVEKLEKDMQAKDEKIKTLEEQNKEYATKIASAKVDSLARKVEDEKPQPQVEEEITFDFEL